MAKNRIRSQLANTAELKSRLNKIKGMKVVFQIGSDRFAASDCANLLIDETAVSDNIQFNRPNDVLVAVKSSRSLQGLDFEADVAGADGNDITIEFTDGATAGSEVVSVLGSAITVQIESGVSTRTQVKDAIDGFPAAAALVDVSIPSSPSTVVTAPDGPESLSGGLDVDALESYDLSDIVMIKRIRTKKWVIQISTNANPA